MNHGKSDFDSGPWDKALLTKVIKALWDNDWLEVPAVVNFILDKIQLGLVGFASNPNSWVHKNPAQHRGADTGSGGRQGHGSMS